GADDERAALYRTRLTGRQVLILLDNARDAAQVRQLLPGSSSCAVLVTTRNRTPPRRGWSPARACRWRSGSARPGWPRAGNGESARWPAGCGASTDGWTS